MNASIFLVEDHPVMRQGLAHLLQRQMGLSVCGDAATFAEALEAVPAVAPDLVLLDLTLEDGNGLDLIRQLKKQLPALKLLVVSMHDETVYAERALQAGAQGYVMKSAPAQVLVTAVRTVLEDRIYVSERMREQLLEVNTWTGGDPAVSPLERLSDRELEVFQHLGQGCTTQEIAGRMGVSAGTVSTYRERIKEKLGLRNAVELVQHAASWVAHGMKA